MAFLEEKKFVHRDLAARNVLVNEEGTAKVRYFIHLLRSLESSDLRII